MPAIHIDTSVVIANVDDRIYSGFLEHLGRCIYGGIVPESGTDQSLVTQSGFRKDILHIIRDDLKVKAVRWPGGNFVSNYHWQDGIGPKESRPRRQELAWGGVESNQFGIDEFIEWCKEANTEPYVCLNMGTGTLEEALALLEYANGTKDTRWANLRRKNTGRAEPHGIKLWGLGNEMWGEWQIGRLNATEYATKAESWAHALKTLDPSISLISCGESGFSSWDYTVLQKVIKWIDFHSIHMYTSPGQIAGQPQGERYQRNVFGPIVAEHALNTVRGLLDLCRIEQKVNRPVTVAYDEWNVWDFEKGTPEDGLEQHYDLSDALAVAGWLNVFIRKADIVSVACIAQSVNVISPILTSKQGHLLQTIYYPLHLFSTYMRSGASIMVNVVDAPMYSGTTSPEWVQTLKGPLPYLDCSAMLVGRSVRVAVVNRHPTDALSCRISIGGNHVTGPIQKFEVWHPNPDASNTFETPDVVQTAESRMDWNRDEEVVFKEHSFTLLVLTLE